MVNVAILGATGYTALELIKILLRNPQVNITALTTRQEGAPPIHTIHPSLYGRLDAACEDLSPAEVCRRGWFVFCCLPHVGGMGVVPSLLGGGCPVVDLSVDLRLSDKAVHEKLEGHSHTHTGRLGK